MPKKIDLAPSYAKGILQLLEKGEERLIQAVERRQIPITIAITVARSSDQEVQRALTEAYEDNALRGKAVLTARRIIEQRRVHGKSLRSKQPRNGAKPVSSKDIMRTYRQETNRQKTVIQKAKICETRLLFAVSALKQLFNDENFSNLIRAEGLETVPRFLAQQCNSKEQQ